MQQWLRELGGIMSIFFVGLNPRWQLFPWLPDGLHIMYSVAGAWEAWANNQTRARKFPTNSGLRWLDCGGFTMLNKYEDYPFGIDWYLNFVAQVQPDYYATMDYPCEPDISRGMVKTNRERIEATVANAVRVLEMGDMVQPATAVPVIQGYSLDEYLLCLDLHQQAGTIRPYMAVGSMCNRSNDAELETLVPAIHEAAVAHGVHRLHWFGLKLSSATFGLQEYIYSRDSAATYYAPTEAVKAAWGGNRWAKTPAQKRQAYEILFDRAHEAELVYSHVAQHACPECDSVQVCPDEADWAWLCADCGHLFEMEDGAGLVPDRVNWGWVLQ